MGVKVARLKVFELGEAEGGAEVFAELDPVALGDGEKDFDDFGIELRAGATADLFAGVGHGQGFAVRAVADHGVERIGDGEYARAERNLFALEATRVAGTIVELLVSEDDFGGVA